MTRSQLFRCLREFPCLWALSREWDFTTDSITFEYATHEQFDAEDPYVGWTPWIYLCPSKYSHPTRFKLELYSPGWDQRFGSGALFTSGPGTECIILHRDTKGKNEVRVVRPPRKQTMWQFLQRYDPRKR